MAALLGVNVDRTISLTFVMGAALAAVAGLMFLLYYGVIDFYIGFLAGVKAFTAAVLGGIGSLPGAMLGGLLIGLIEAFWSGYFTVEYKDVAAFSILAIVLDLPAVRPARPAGSREGLSDGDGSPAACQHPALGAERDVERLALRCAASRRCTRAAHVGNLLRRSLKDAGIAGIVAALGSSSWCVKTEIGAGACS